MGGGHDIRSCRVDLGVDGEGGGVDRPVAVDHLPDLIDQEKVSDPDLLEVHAEWIDPEMVKMLGIPCRDVAGDPFVEAEMPKQAKGGGQALLAVSTLVSRVVE